MSIAFNLFPAWSASLATWLAWALVMNGGAHQAHALDFTRILGVAPVDSAGGSRSVNWIDVDSDGDLDLYVANGGSLGENNEFFRNDSGSLVRTGGLPIVLDGLRDVSSTWGDYDNDGDEDVFIASWYGELNALYENLGGGSFQVVSTGPVVTTGTFSEGSAWADYDNDGDLDLFVANSGGTFRNLLYRNEGGGTFSAVVGDPVVTDLGTSRHGAWADYDEDGDQDLFVVNEANQANRLYQNRLVETGTADFLSVSAGDVTGDLTSSFSASWGDFDNDTDLDLVVANNSGQTNAFYRNELAETGTASFTKILNEGPSSVGTGPLVRNGRISTTMGIWISS